MRQTFSAVIIFAVTLLAAGCENTADQTSLKVKAKRADDKVEIKFEKGRVVISIRSPFGISHASIERRSNWPEAIVLRLHLRGLESLKLSNGQITIEAAVSSLEDPKAVRQWRDGKEDRPLDDSSASWITMNRLEHGSKKATGSPEEDSGFEIHVPAILLQDDSRTLTVSWIDFYR